MIKTPGRKPQSPNPSSSRKNQLSSDAKIIITLIKEQPQTKEEICKETKISPRTFYRIISLLEEQKIVKCEDHTYALWYFNPLEKQIEAALSKYITEEKYVTCNIIVDEIGKPWREIEALTLEVAKKKGLRITELNGQTTFL
jgi:hypothetical protein